MAKQSYAGCAFCPNLGAETVPGTISFDAASLCFFAESGRIEISLQRLHIRRDEMSGRIFFSDPQMPDTIVFTDDDDIFGHRPFVISRNCVNGLRS